MTEKEIKEKYPTTDFERTFIGRTPSGGRFSVMRWSRLDGTPCKKKDAQVLSITEYDSDGNSINLTESLL